MGEREEFEKNILCTAQFAHKRTNGIGIALGGGLARGLAHIGVIKTLLKEGIQPQIVSGTSIGSVVGGCYLMDKLDDLEEWALSLNRKKVLSYLDVRVRSAGLIGGNRLMDLLHSHFGSAKIEDMKYPYAAIATNLLTGHEVWLQRGELTEAMRASFSLPGMFPPVRRKDRFLIDGGLVNPVPIAPCQAMGARCTIAVDLTTDMLGQASKPGKNFQTIAGFDMFNEDDVPLEEQKKVSNSITRRIFRRQDEDSPSLFGVMMSSLGIMQDRLTRMRLASDPPDIHIKPQIGHIGLAEFERAKELIGEGEIAALKQIKHIKETLPLLLRRAEEEHYT